MGVGEKIFHCCHETGFHLNETVKFGFRVLISNLEEIWPFYWFKNLISRDDIDYNFYKCVVSNNNECVLKTVGLL